MNITASAVSVTVDDPAASSLFFTTHLGFREVLVTEEFIALQRDDAAADVVLQRCGDAEPRHQQAGFLLAFTVTGVAAEHERLRAEGATITMPLRQEPWGDVLFQLTDPNGIVVQLVEWAPWVA
ncbi:hypothetical protein Lfu02_42070 [Longispora fulva]|uniref:Catechol 2,3-dioxygenase-like lactoylglutathione lyase family enzyme n=1 Tax=Longispora fulva TaxID=619741 RepID=A0A8J7GT49_9ACTN|nr:VOC family protein [Longispora fulva]MBG6136666.1 catechol 2,3-dioxygenase-like lactoylglutathione lyase family enzyme [Longispora fulva]GIG59835.1 hypothetical protein Lfu02_42070 [Longispora fulva]